MESDHSTPSYDNFVEQLPGRLHGRRLDNPIYAASKHSIRPKLHGGKPVKAESKRNSLIIQRANWVTQLSLRLPATGFDKKEFRATLAGARCSKERHLGVSVAPDYLPAIELLQEAFPSEETTEDEVIESHRQRMNMINRLEARQPSDLLQRSLAHLRSQPVAYYLSEAFETAVNNHGIAKISKIVGFGANGILFWDNDTGYLGKDRAPAVARIDFLERASMWSSLFLMREILSDHGIVTSDTAIYAQDPGFRESEVTALERDGVSVLCGAYGHQQGFVEVDNEAMVVLFCPHIDFLGLIMEIDDPPLILVNEHLQSSMGQLGADREAAGYRLGGFPELDIPSGNIPVKYTKLFSEYAEVALTSIDTPSPLPQLHLCSRLFIRRRK